MVRTKKEPTAAGRLAAALVPAAEQPYAVPANWRWVRLGSLVNLLRGVSYKKTDVHFPKQENDCLILRGGNIQEGAITFDSDNVYVDKSLVKKEQFVKANDVVIVASTGSVKVIGRAGIVDKDYSDVAFGAFLLLARPRENICKKFVDFYFQNDLYRNRIKRMVSGVNINNIRAEHITEAPFPLPPLAEQQRIVARIETLFARIDEAEEKLRDAADTFAARRAALLRVAFTGRLTAAWRTAHGRSLDEWRETEVKHICKEIKVGIVIKPSQYYTTADKGIPAFRSANVREFRVDDFDWVYLDERGQKENPRSIVHTGDILIVRSGNPGTACVVTKKFDGYNAIDILIAVPDSEKVDSNFLCAFTNSPIGRQLVEANKRGMALAHFNVGKYSKLPISLPPLDEQQEIVRVLDETLAREDAARAAAEAASAAIPALRRAILARAFRGGLGTNDPADPPALPAD